MTKLFKIILSGLVTLIFLLFITVGLLLVFVNPNNFKDEISNYVHEQTGRTLTLKGDLHWKIYPRLSITVNDALLSNPKDFPNESFATINRADINIQLLPLLHGEFDTSRISLHSLHLFLHRKPSGKTNWDDLIKPRKASSPKLQKATDSDAKPIIFKLSAVNISNASINLNDEKLKQDTSFTNVNLTANNIQFKKPFPVALNVNYKTTKPKTTGHFTLSSSVTLNIPNQYYAIKNLVIDGKHRDSTFKLSGNILADLHKQTVSAKGITGSFAGLNLETQFEAKQILSKPSYQGTISISPFSPAKFSQSIGLKSASGISQLFLKAAFQGTKDSLNLTNLNSAINGTTLSGNIHFVSLSKKIVNFKLSADKIKPPRAKPRKKTKKGRKSKSSSTPSPLKGWNISGSLSVKRLTLPQLLVTNLSTKVKTTNGKIRLSPLGANLMQGRLQGSLTIDPRKRLPRYSLAAKFSGLKLKRSSKTMLASHHLSGVLTISAKVNTVGTKTATLIRNLNGSGSFSLANGSIDGSGMMYQLGRIRDYLKKRPGSKKTRTKRIKLNKVTGSFGVKRGVLSNRNLLILSSEGKTTGRGSVSLVSRRINYRLLTTTTSPSALKLVPQLVKNGALHIPLIVTGTLDNPVITPDFGAIGSLIIKDKIRDTIKDQLKVDDKIKSVIDKIF